MAMPSGSGRKTHKAWRNIVCLIMLATALVLFPVQGLAETLDEGTAVAVEEVTPGEEAVVEETPAASDTDEPSDKAAVASDEVPVEALTQQTDAAPVALEVQEVRQGWYDLAGNKTTAASSPQGANWYDNGVMARSKEVYDRDTDAWYWFDADGTCARNKDVYLQSSGGKWVRYDINGRMIKGEDYRYGAWYYFDLVTGAMAKSWKHLDSSGGKWVYYDPIDGRMAKGEKWVTGSGGDGWCYFDDVTGALQFGWRHVDSNGGKWVYYVPVNGRIHFGETYVTGSGSDGWCYFDDTTGALQFGWKYLGSNGGKWVYYDLVNGRMLRGIHTVDGKQCRFNDVTGAYEGEVSSGGGSSSGSGTGSGTVYWTSGGYAYHSNPGCRSLARSTNIQSGSLADAQARGKTPCRNCYH